jgi:DNA-binding NtrC family response regulator
MASYKLLFVDDDPAVLRSLGEYFSRLGHEVHRAANGKDGVAAWESVRPDVTVCDLAMPEMDGFAVLERLRRHSAVIIMLTGYGDIESAVRAMRLGAENFLTKPIEMSHLVEAVEKAAEKAALRRENVELRARLRPTLRRRLVRYGMVAALVVASVALGRMIGGGPEDLRPRSPIPVPLDTTERE